MESRVGAEAPLATSPRARGDWVPPKPEVTSWAASTVDEPATSDFWRQWSWFLIGAPVSIAMFFWVRFAAPRIYPLVAGIPPAWGTAFFLALLVGAGLYVDHLFPEDFDDATD